MKRGPKRRSFDKTCVTTANITTAQNLHLVASCATVVLAQELKTHELNMASLPNKCARLPQVYANASSVSDSGGLSAGVGVFASKKFPLAKPADVPCEIELPPERASFALYGGITGGVLLVSAYLYTGENLLGRNGHILRAIGERIRAYGLPFILGADFQNDPASLWDTMLLSLPAVSPPASLLMKATRSTTLLSLTACSISSKGAKS